MEKGFSRKSKPHQGEEIPLGFRLRHVLRGHKNIIHQIVWHPNKELLASVDDTNIRIWNTETGELYKTLAGYFSYSLSWSFDGETLTSGNISKLILWDTEAEQHQWKDQEASSSALCVAWSPIGKSLAEASDRNIIQIWDAMGKSVFRTMRGHTDAIYSLAWSPDVQMLASGSDDKTIRLWDVETGKLSLTLRGHTDSVNSVAWSPNGQLIASGSDDKTIRLWDPATGRQLIRLDGHTNAVIDVSFSYDSRLLATKSKDGTVRIWNPDTGEALAILNESASKDGWYSSLAFHPRKPILATLGEKDTILRIWDLDFETLLTHPLDTSLIHYTSAKVVLVGDSGVGKSGLSLVLTGQEYIPTDSTHGRRVMIFDSQEVALGHKRKEIRETLLWDLAGQPEYRLIHQLHLDEVTIALIIFDSHSEIDPFVGVYHWTRALRVAQRIQSNAAHQMKILLVAGRIDRGGRGVGLDRIQSLVNELGFEAFFETSAKEGHNIKELKEAIKGFIDWSKLPKVSSTRLFQQIQNFLIKQKDMGQVISTVDDLYHTFFQYEDADKKAEDFRTEFETCIGHVESQGFIRRLDFGNLVLLQPERLDSYASALVIEAKDEPDGLGSIAEESARKGCFAIPQDERIKDSAQERLLLIAMIDDLLKREIALREETAEGSRLVFPSQSTRRHPHLPDPGGIKTVVFSFEGPVQNIYTTLAVRLSHSGLFNKKELWQNAITYTTKAGGTCGLFLQNAGEGMGELALFFDKTVSPEIRTYFEEYVHMHLQRKALPESIKVQQALICKNCNSSAPDLLIQIRIDHGFNWLICPICNERIDIPDSKDKFIAIASSTTLEMDRAADDRRELARRQAVLQGKIDVKYFDVFLCYNSADRAVVKKIGEQLKEHGILPWLDEWELRPGLPWQLLIEREIGRIRSAAIFVGKEGIGPWQDMEVMSFLREFVKRECPAIPVILPDCDKVPELPIFLKGMTWVDFRQQDPDPMEHLIWGITGEREA